MFNISEISEISKEHKLNDKQKRTLDKLFHKAYLECLDFDILLGPETIRMQDNLSNMTFKEYENVYKEKSDSVLFHNFADALCSYLYSRPAIFDDEVRNGKLYRADKYYPILREAYIKLALQKEISKDDFLKNIKQKSAIEILDLCDKATDIHDRLLFANILLYDRLTEMVHENCDRFGPKHSEIEIDVVEYKIDVLSKKIARMRKIKNRLENKRYHRASYEYMKAFRGTLTRAKTTQPKIEPGEEE